MPVGVYRKRTKNGRWMYFRDGKLISKKSYDASTSRRKSKPRKANGKKNNNRSYMRKSIPHPSVTGMASGLAIAAYLNAGTPTTTQTGTTLGTITTMGEGVIKDVTDGELGKAFSTLSGNAISMISSDQGRKTLVTASGIALLGAFARKQFPQLKLGGSKLYFRL